MKRDISWSDDARKQLRRLDKPTRERVRQALHQFAETGHGDVVRLHGSETGLRLRVGEWRLRFDFVEETGAIIVHAVLPRGDAYKRR